MIQYKVAHMNIIPAILTKDKKSFKEQIVRLLSYFDTFQIDVQDGQFVQSTTLSMSDISSSLELLLQDTRIDLSRVKFDFHLMLKDYSKALEYIDHMPNKLDIRYIFVHRNMVTFPSNLSEKTKNKICPTLNPSDKDLLEKHRTFLDKRLSEYGAIQVMTIHPGPQGQEIDYNNLEKIRLLRESGFKGEMLVDGSMNPDTIAKILSMDEVYWPDTVCVGSYLSQSADEELPSKVDALSEIIVV